MILDILGVLLVLWLIRGAIIFIYLVHEDNAMYAHSHKPSWEIAASNDKPVKITDPDYLEQASKKRVAYYASRGIKVKP